MTIFIIIWISWIGSEVFLNRFLRSDQKESVNYDHGTLRRIWITIGIAVTVGLVFSNLEVAPIRTSIRLPYLGLVMIVLGMAIRFIAIYTLGEFFTVEIAFTKGQRIKKDGLYKYLRHPSYLGALVSFLGLGISLNNWITIVVIVVPVTWSFILRIKAEEKMLIEKLGNDYLNYIKNTKRLVPFIY